MTMQSPTETRSESESPVTSDARTRVRNTLHRRLSRLNHVTVNADSTEHPDEQTREEFRVSVEIMCTRDDGTLVPQDEVLEFIEKQEFMYNGRKYGIVNESLTTRGPHQISGSVSVGIVE